MIDSAVIKYKIFIPKMKNGKEGKHRDINLPPLRLKGNQSKHKIQRPLKEWETDHAINATRANRDMRPPTDILTIFGNNT